MFAGMASHHGVEICINGTAHCPFSPHFHIGSCVRFTWHPSCKEREGKVETISVPAKTLARDDKYLRERNFGTSPGEGVAFCPDDHEPW